MKKHVFSLLIAAFVALSTSVGYAFTWKWVYSDEYEGLFFDIDKIRFELDYSDQNTPPKIDPYRITVWEKTVVTQAGANRLSELTKDNRLSKLDHILSLETFSVSNRTITIHTRDYYDRDGNFIRSSDQGQTYKIDYGTWTSKLLTDILEYTITHRDELIRNAYEN